MTTENLSAARAAKIRFVFGDRRTVSHAAEDGGEIITLHPEESTNHLPPGLPAPTLHLTIDEVAH